MGPKRRSRFTPQEDEQLRKLIAEHGYHAWPLVSKSMSGRSPRVCRDRWRYYLSKGDENHPWTPEEDALLLEKIAEHGPRWARLSEDFPNRSDLAIKHRWSQIFNTQRKMLLRDTLNPPARRKSGAEQKNQNDKEAMTVPIPESASVCQSSKGVDWDSWEWL
jgi:hypothetical protein